jgi:hypothetical protein
MRRNQRAWFAGVLLFFVSACTGEDDAGTGTLSLSVSGGEGVRDGFPHTEGTSVREFVDGWELSFDRFIVSVGNIRLSEPETTNVNAELAGPFAVDLAASADAVVPLDAITDAPAVRQDFELSLLSGAQATNVNLSDADFSQLSADGATMWLSGTAVRGDEVVPFDLRFTRPARFFRCSNGLDNTRGVAVPRNGESTALISMHVLHLFQDALAIAEGGLFFDAIAARAGDDGVVTLEELRDQSIQGPLDAEGSVITVGSRPLVYNDNGLLAPSDYNLAVFLEHAARNLIHFNGLGLCAQQWL